MQRRFTLFALLGSFLIALPTLALAQAALPEVPSLKDAGLQVEYAQADARCMVDVVRRIGRLD